MKDIKSKLDKAASALFAMGTPTDKNTSPATKKNLCRRFVLRISRSGKPRIEECDLT